MDLAKRLKNVESANDLSEILGMSIGNNLLFAPIDPPGCDLSQPPKFLAIPNLGA